MSRNHEYPAYKRIINGVIVGGVGALTLSGCTSAQEVTPTPSVTTEAPTTAPSIITSTEWPPKSGAACPADQLPPIVAQPGNTGYYVFETRSGCTDYGIDLYEKPQLKGTPSGKMQPETPFAIYCASKIGAQMVAEISATDIHPARGYAALGAAAAEFVAQIPAGKPDCPMY